MPKRDGLRADLRGKLDMEESTPGWQERILERTSGINPATQRPKVNKKHGHDIHFLAGERMKALVNLAAEKRGIGRATYFRRALAAFIAYDLGLTPEDVLEGGPTPHAWGESGGNGNRGTGDDLSGFGPWRLDGLHE